MIFATRLSPRPSRDHGVTFRARRRPACATRCVALVALLVLGTIPEQGKAQDVRSAALTEAVAKDRLADARSLMVEGVTPSPFHLMLALQLSEPEEMVRALVGGGADPDVVAPLPDDDRTLSALDWLALSGDVAEMELLLDLGAHPDFRVDAQGMTPLMMAAMQGKAEAVDVLLAAGSDPTLTDGGGGTALEWAVLKAGASGDTRIVESLTRAGAAGGDVAMDLLLEGLNVDGTFQPGHQSLRPEEIVYGVGSFTGPCVNRRTPAIDPARPNPGDSGSGSYRETHVWFDGGMSVGLISPPNCTPLHLGPAKYKVQVMGGDYSWVWRCTAPRGGRCLRVTREGTEDMVLYDFAMSVEADASPVADPDRCATASLSITSPAKGEQFSYDSTGVRLEIQLEAKVSPEGCADEVTWVADDIQGAVKTFDGASGPGQGDTVLLAYEGLPQDNSEFGTKTIRARVGGGEKTVDIEAFFPPRATNHPPAHPTLATMGRGIPNRRVPNWFYYWTQGAVPDLERFLYSPRATYGWGEYDPNTDTLEVGPEASLLYPGVTIPLHSPVAYCTPAVASIQTRDTRGIEATARVVAHELRHQDLFSRAGNELVDPDGDGVPKPEDDFDSGNLCLVSELATLNEWARRSGTRNPVSNPANTHGLSAATLHVAPGDRAKAEATLARYGDNELLAIYAESKGSWNVALDWSWCGRQWKDASVCPQGRIW